MSESFTMATKYNELVNYMAEGALDWLNEEGYNYTEAEAVSRIIDDRFFWGDDQAIVLAHALINSLVSWGEEVDWEAINQNFWEDIYSELAELKKAKE